MNSQGGKEPKMKKLLKSKKALSPVVAAIILIAVTVAVSIAVAAWMGSLTFTFMETEELKITTSTLNSTTAASPAISLFVVNSGSEDVTLASVKVSGGGETETVATTDPITAGGSATIDIDLTGDVTLVAGTSYTIELVTSKGNVFTIKGTATDL